MGWNVIANGASSSVSSFKVVLVLVLSMDLDGKVTVETARALVFDLDFLRPREGWERVVGGGG